MKKTLSVLLCFVLILSFTACANTNTDGENEAKQNGSTISSSADSSSKKDEATPLDPSQDKRGTSKDILIAYFSCSGNTAQMADYISAETGGVLFAITPVKPYVNEDLDYSNKSCRSRLEQKDASARPEILDRVENFDSYTTIYLGYPIWYGDAPKIIYTFLESYDFSGKTIIPFCTSSETDITESAANIKKLAPKAKWKKGKRFSPSALQKDIAKWVS